jgi:hypothetical protein
MATVLTDEERSTSKVGHMQAVKAYGGKLSYSSIGTDGDGWFELFMYETCKESEDTSRVGR